MVQCGRLVAKLFEACPPSEAYLPGSCEACPPGSCEAYLPGAPGEVRC